ncbi:hybrid signal transduction histidine kinase K-like [Anastrepha obliqua]|uniref:hybrid signal transduction histidine kinase K-like n=1 Tax=Anastrepha obliqua TaxID=95512 RepID=UPI002409D991|nr:hybrid signal transduction histidine kinase K-like [Anastrepha obliqua]
MFVPLASLNMRMKVRSRGGFSNNFQGYTILTTMNVTNMSLETNNKSQNCVVKRFSSSSSNSSNSGSGSGGNNSKNNNNNHIDTKMDPEDIRKILEADSTSDSEDFFRGSSDNFLPGDCTTSSDSEDSVDEENEDAEEKFLPSGVLSSNSGNDDTESDIDDVALNPKFCTKTNCLWTSELHNIKPYTKTFKYRSDTTRKKYWY